MVTGITRDILSRTNQRLYDALHVGSLIKTGENAGKFDRNGQFIYSRIQRDANGDRIIDPQDNTRYVLETVTRKGYAHQIIPYYQDMLQNLEELAKSQIVLGVSSGGVSIIKSEEIHQNPNYGDYQGSVRNFSQTWSLDVIVTIAMSDQAPDRSKQFGTSTTIYDIEDDVNVLLNGWFPHPQTIQPLKLSGISPSSGFGGQPFSAAAQMNFQTVVQCPDDRLDAYTQLELDTLNIEREPYDN